MYRDSVIALNTMASASPETVFPKTHLCNNGWRIMGILGLTKGAGIHRNRTSFVARGGGED